MQISYFQYFGHTWQQTPKMIVSTCRRLKCLSVCQKYISSITSFLGYYILKNPVISLADSILAYNLRTRNLPYGIGGEISITILVFIFDYFQEKLMTKIFKKSKKKTNYFETILCLFV